MYTYSIESPRAKRCRHRARDIASAARFHVVCCINPKAVAIVLARSSEAAATAEARELRERWPGSGQFPIGRPFRVVRLEA